MLDLDIHDFKRSMWLHHPANWGSPFYGWSLNENETQEAIFMRVPPHYKFNGKRIDASPEQIFFNKIRFAIPNMKYTATFNFKKVGAQVWEKELRFFQKSEKEIKKAIAEFPKYFKLIDGLSSGKIHPEDLKNTDPEVIEIWKW